MTENNRNYWLHRISWKAELSYPLLDKGFLTIGFSKLTSRTFVNNVSDNLSYCEKEFEKEFGKSKVRQNYLLRFMKEFKKGDLVIVPTWKSFIVCEIVDDRPLMIGEVFSEDLKAWGDKTVKTDGTHLLSENGDVYDLGFARKVEILHKGISREKFADAKLTARLKTRHTNGSINDLKESVDSSIQNHKINKPINLYLEIVDKTASTILSTIKEQLIPDKFEKLIASYFETIGANNVIIPAKNGAGKEGDSDIIATFENIKLIIYVQAKFHEGETSDWGVNQVLDYKLNKESINEGYNRIAWLITTADSFSKEAQNVAIENEIQLINGHEFAEMLLNSGINILKQ